MLNRLVQLLKNQFEIKITTITTTPSVIVATKKKMNSIDIILTMLVMAVVASTQPIAVIISLLEMTTPELAISMVIDANSI